MNEPASVAESQPTPFGKYWLLHRLNAGGMAEVFVAKSFGVEGFERLLAVKRILPHIAADQQFIQMFVDEAKLASRLQHANIAQIFELGRVSEDYYIALEYVPGRDLKQVWERVRQLDAHIPIPLAVLLVSQVCGGLDYAHSKKDAAGVPLQIVHRDVSPQNVLVSWEGEVKLIDFGVAKATSTADDTRVGLLKGKLSYMSPEQVRGMPLDRRSDTFAAGIVLYEMITGERLFLGDSDLDTLERVRKVEVAPPSLFNPDVTPELEEIVLTALQKHPNHRYQSALDMQLALQRWLFSQPGPPCSARDLGAFMETIFADEVARERERMAWYQGLSFEQLSATGEEFGWEDAESETQVFSRGAEGDEAPVALSSSWGEEADQPATPVPVAPPVATPAPAPPPPRTTGAPPRVTGAPPAIPGRATGAPPALPASEGAAPRITGAPRTTGAPPAAPAPRHAAPTVAVTMPARPAAAPAPPGGGSRQSTTWMLAAAAAVVLAILAVLVWNSRGGAEPTGALVVLTDPLVPQARLALNQMPVHDGALPWQQASLAAGTYALQVQAAGYEDRTVQVRVAAGEQTRTTVTLQPRMAPPLRISSTPGGARLTVNGESVGTTPFTLRDRPLGATLEIVVQADGHGEARESVTLGPDTRTVALTLPPLAAEGSAAAPPAEPVAAAEPPPAAPVVEQATAPAAPVSRTFQVESVPRGADWVLTVQGSGEEVARGTTPDNTPQLAADQRYRLQVTRDGFEAGSLAFDGNRGNRTLRVTLTPTREAPARPATTRTTEPAPSRTPAAEPAPRPARTPAAQGTGTLSIQSRPAARVILDGTDTGRYTPIINLEVSAGRHSVVLVNEEFGLREQYSINIEAGQSRTIRHTP